MMKVEIKNGKAVELNHLGSEPKVKYFRSEDRFFLKDEARAFKIASEKWQQAEAARKVYEIEDIPCRKSCGPSDFIKGGKCHKNKCYLPDGEIHEAELINETTVRII